MVTRRYPSNFVPIPLNKVFLILSFVAVKSLGGSIIEGDQNQVAVSSLEYFLNLTRSAWAYENASNHGAKAGRLIKNEPHAFSG